MNGKTMIYCKEGREREIRECVSLRVMCPIAAGASGQLTVTVGHR